MHIIGQIHFRQMHERSVIWKQNLLNQTPSLSLREEKKQKKKTRVQMADVCDYEYNRIKRPV